MPLAYSAHIYRMPCEFASTAVTILLAKLAGIKQISVYGSWKICKSPIQLTSYRA